MDAVEEKTSLSLFECVFSCLPAPARLVFLSSPMVKLNKSLESLSSGFDFVPGLFFVKQRNSHEKFSLLVFALEALAGEILEHILNKQECSLCMFVCSYSKAGLNQDTCQIKCFSLTIFSTLDSSFTLQNLCVAPQQHIIGC